MKVYILSHHQGGTPGDSPESTAYSNRADAIQALKAYRKELIEEFRNAEYEIHDDYDYAFYLDTGGDFWEYSMITETTIQ